MSAKRSLSFPLQSREKPRVERQSFGNPLRASPGAALQEDTQSLLRRGILVRIRRGKRPAKEKVPRVGITLINWFERLPFYGQRIDFDHSGHHKCGPRLLNFCFPLWKVRAKVSTPPDGKGLRISIRTEMLKIANHAVTDYRIEEYALGRRYSIG